jgi:ubiquinone biosynthesis protein COQ9
LLLEIARGWPLLEGAFRREGGQIAERTGFVHQRRQCKDSGVTTKTLPAADWASEAEQRLLDAALPRVSEHGWTRRLLAAAAHDADMSAADAELLLPEGARDLAALLSRRHDTRALAALAELDPAAMKVRARIRAGVVARCEEAMKDGEATRRWCGFLALPTNAALGLRLAWESADVLWRWAGDTATDENHYTKRALLAEILVSTLAIRLALGEEAACTHLDGRIGAVMAFEKWKAGVRPAATADKAARVLAKLRYGRRGAPV